jgi:hypothetical protein
MEESFEGFNFELQPLSCPIRQARVAFNNRNRLEQLRRDPLGLCEPETLFTQYLVLRVGKYDCGVVLIDSHGHSEDLRK